MNLGNGGQSHLPLKLELFKPTFCLSHTFGWSSCWEKFNRT